MVTTRRGTETPGQEATPRSSVTKRVGKRALEALDTPTAFKRQKKSTPRQKEVEEALGPEASDKPAQESIEDVSDAIAVTVPPNEVPSKEEPLPIRRRTSPKVVVAKSSPPASTGVENVEEAQEANAAAHTQETIYETPEQQPSSVYATPATRKKAEGSPTPRAKRTDEGTHTSAKKKTHLEVEATKVSLTPSEPNFLDEIPSSTYESEQAPITSQDAPFTPSPPKKAHLRFGSEEPTETHTDVLMNRQGHRRYETPTSAPNQPEENAIEDDDSDDAASDSDEAPEVVTIIAAASRAKSTQQEADRALQAQQDKDRLKREAREKRKAEEQAEKQKREEKKAKKLAKQLAKQQQAEPESDGEAPASRMDIDPRNLPALLPDSLLSTLTDQRAPTPPPERRGKTAEELRKEKMNHHIKFLEKTDKGIKDVKKGKLSVSVLGQHNRVLPPKVNRATKTVREQWLKGQIVEQKKGGKANIKFGKMERRAHGNRGFLRNED